MQKRVIQSSDDSEPSGGWTRKFLQKITTNNTDFFKNWSLSMNKKNYEADNLVPKHESCLLSSLTQCARSQADLRPSETFYASRNDPLLIPPLDATPEIHIDTIKKDFLTTSDCRHSNSNTPCQGLPFDTVVSHADQHNDSKNCYNHDLRLSAQATPEALAYRHFPCAPRFSRPDISFEGQESVRGKISEIRSFKAPSVPFLDTNTNNYIWFQTTTVPFTRLEVFPHSLYNVMAVMSPSSLCVVKWPSFVMVQSIFHPTATLHSLHVTSSLPLRLDDAYTLINEKTVTSINDKTDILLTASWHRESLTLAVGTSKALYIFKPSPTLILSLSTFDGLDDTPLFHGTQSCSTLLQSSCKDMFTLAFSTTLISPCSVVFWVHDDLVTDATNYCDNYTGTNRDEMDGKNASYFPVPETFSMSSKFCVWKCCFNRCTNSFSTAYQNPIMADQMPPVSPLYTSPQYFDIHSPEYSFLRNVWVDKKPLADLSHCVKMPQFSWSAIVGQNSQTLLPPSFSKCSFNDDKKCYNDRPTLQVHRLLPHPAGRFIAVLYNLSVTSLPPDTTVSSVVVPSPIVRVWCLSVSSLPPNALSDQMSLSRHLSRHREDSISPSTLWYRIKLWLKKRKGIKLGCYSGCKPGRVVSCLQPKVRGQPLKSPRSKEFVSTQAECDSRMDSKSSLQGPELTILRQLTTAWDMQLKNHSNIHLTLHRHPSLKPKLSKLLLKSVQRHSSDENLEFMKQKSKHHKLSKFSNDEMPRVLDTLLDLNIENKDHVYGCDSDTPTFSQHSTVFKDGPYLSLSLLHRTPVIDVLWRDTGAVSDAVFVPAVVCCLTLDHCLTIWIESDYKMPLAFNAAIIVRLELIPTTTLLSGANPVKSSATQSFSPYESMLGSGQPIHQPSKQFSCHSSQNIFHQTNVSQVMTRDVLTFCWLTMHHVNYDDFHIDNILRLCKAQAVTEGIDFFMLESNAALYKETVLKENQTSSDPFSNTLYKFTRHQSVTSYPLAHDNGNDHADSQNNSSTDVLSLGPNGHVTSSAIVNHSDDTKQNFQKLSSANLQFFRHNTNINLLDYPSQIDVPTQSSAYHSLDFLLVAERISTAVHTSSETCGLWVYIFRNLVPSFHTKTEPAVKELLNPDHLKLPCQVYSLISASCIPSLGLCDSLFSEKNIGSFGCEVIVKDGIIFPASYITILSPFGEIWSCIVKPHVTYKASELTEPNHVVKVSYCVTIRNVCRLFPFIGEMSWTAQNPLFTKAHDTKNFALTSFSSVSSKKKHSFWTCLEEHPLNASVSIALDDLGRLFLCPIDLVDCSLDAHDHDASLSSLPQTAMYCFSNQESSDFSECPMDKNAHLYELLMPYASFQDMGCSPKINDTGHCHGKLIDSNEPLKKIVSFDSLSQPWLNDDLALQNPLGNRFNLPPIRFVTWLPLLGAPCIALCVTEPYGHLLALGVTSTLVGNPAQFKGFGFKGQLTEQVTEILDIIPSSSTQDNYDEHHQAGTESNRNASVTYLQVACQTNHICLILLRVTSKHLSYRDGDRGECFEESIILLRCYRSDSPHSKNLPEIDESFTVDSLHPFLMADLIFVKVLDWPRLCFSAQLSPLNHGSLDINQKECVSPFWEPQLCFSCSSASTKSFCAGLVAMFPPSNLNELSDVFVPKDLFFISLHQFEESQLTFLAFASVSLPMISHSSGENSSKEEKNPMLHQVIVGLTMNEDYLAAMTYTGCVLIYSLLNIVSTLKEPEALASLFHSKYQRQENSFCEEMRREDVGSTKSVCRPVFLPSSCIDLRLPLTKHHMSLFQNYTTQKFQGKNTPFIHDPSSKDRTVEDNLILRPQRLGDPAYVSFRYTGRNGLLILVLLRSEKEVTDLSQLGTLTSIPFCFPYVFYKYTRLNKDTWLECPMDFPKKIEATLKSYQESLEGPKGEIWSIPFLSFGHDCSQLLIGLSSFSPTSQTSSLHTPLSLTIPPSILELACTASASRALYHPLVLTAHLRGPSCSCYLRIILNKLYMDLCHWREHFGEKHFSPVLDFSVPFLNTIFEPNYTAFPAWLSAHDPLSGSASRKNFTLSIHPCIGLEKYEKITAERLDKLIYLLDLQHKENLLWLETHGVLLPHLNLHETIQLHGLLQFLSILFLPVFTLEEQRKDTDLSRCAETSYAELVDLTERPEGGRFSDLNNHYDQNGSVKMVDLPGAYYLLGYGASVCMRNSLQSANQLKEHLEATPLETHFVDVTHKSMENHHPESNDTSLHYVVKLLNQSTTTTFLHEQVSHLQSLNVTSFDVAWALQSSSTQHLFKRTVDLSIRLKLVDQEASLLLHDHEKHLVTWSFLRSAGAGMWISHPETVWQLASETIPKNTFALQPVSEKNPDDIALWYIATNHISVLQGLYKIKKNIKVVEFLSHDFNETRWISAASKNGYTLLRKKRYMLATAFFLLGHAYQEALDVCCGQLDDPQLALFLVKILLFRFKLDKEKCIMMQSLLEHLIYDKLLPSAIEADDEWLQSVLFWISGSYADAVICIMPRSLRPSLESERLDDHRYDLYRSFFKPVVYLTKKQEKNAFTEQIGPLRKDSVCNSPLHYTSQTHTKHIYRCYVLSTTQVQQMVLPDSFNDPLKRGFSNEAFVTTSSFFQQEGNEDSSPRPNKDRTSLDTNHSVTAKELCYMMMTHENLLFQRERHDIFLDILLELRFPFGCYSMKTDENQFHWIQVTCLFRRFFDPVCQLHNESWQEMCESLMQILHQKKLNIKEDPLLVSPVVGWCPSQGPEQFTYWLSKLFRHTERKRGKEEATFLNLPSDQFTHGSIFTSYQTLNRGLFYMSQGTYYSLNKYLRHTPRLNFISCLDNIHAKKYVKPCLLYGWINSLVSLCSVIFRIETTYGWINLVTKRINNDCRLFDHLRAACMITLGYFRISCAIGSDVSCSENPAILSLYLITMSLSLSSCLILLIEKQRKTEQFLYTTIEENSKDRLSQALHDRGDNDSSYDMVFARIEHLATCLKAFAALLSIQSFSDAFLDSILKISGVIFSLILFTESNPDSPRSPCDSDTNAENVNPFCETNRVRRGRLWNRLQEILFAGLYEDSLVILRKCLILTQNLFTNLSMNTGNVNDVAMKTLTFQISVSSSLLNFTGSPSPSEDSKDGLSLPLSGSLRLLVESFHGLVVFLEEIFHFEYRPSALTRFILFASLDFPYFIPRMWVPKNPLIQTIPRDTTIAMTHATDLPSNPTMMTTTTTTNTTGIATPPITTTAGGVSTNTTATSTVASGGGGGGGNGEEHQPDAVWLSLFEETAPNYDKSVLSFFRLWCMFSCRLRLELFLTRSSIHYLPEIFTTLLYNSSLNPSVTPSFPLVRDTCQALCADRIQPFHFLYRIPTLSGSPLSMCNGVPVGFSGNLSSQDHGSGLGWLLVCSGRTVTDLNIAQTFLLQHFGMTQLYLSNLGHHHGASALHPPKQSLGLKSLRLLSYSRSFHKLTNDTSEPSDKHNDESVSPRLKIQRQPTTTMKLSSYEEILSQCVNELFTCSTWMLSTEQINLPFGNTLKEDQSTTDLHPQTNKSHPVVQLLSNKKSNGGAGDSKQDSSTKQHRLAHFSSFGRKDGMSSQNSMLFKLKHPLLVHFSEHQHDHVSPFLRRLVASLRQSLYKDKLTRQNSSCPDFSPASQVLLVSAELFLRGLCSPSELVIDQTSWVTVQSLKKTCLPFISRGLICSSISSSKEGQFGVNSTELQKRSTFTDEQKCKMEESSTQSFLWIQYIRNLYFEANFRTLKKLQSVLVQQEKSEHLIKKVYNHSHIVLLVSHPTLPIAAGVLVTFLKESIAHVAHGTVPIIGIWAFQASQLLGVLTLSTVSPRSHTAPATQVNGSHSSMVAATGSTDSQITTMPSDNKQRPHTMFSPWLSKQRYFRKSMKCDQPPTYQETGHVVCLQWSTCGQYLVAGHAKGWITIWRLFDTKMDLNLIGNTQNANGHMFSADQSRPPNHVSMVSSLNSSSLGGPPISFKLHLGQCCHVTLVSNDFSGSMTLMTTGRGLDTTVYTQYFSNHQDKKSSSFHHKPPLNTVDQTFICTWNLVGHFSEVKHFSCHGELQLKTADTHLSRQDEPTHFAFWPARQILFYSTRRGAVYFFNLRTLKPSPCSIIQPPVNTQLLIDHLKDNETMFHRHNELHGKGILRLFVLESTRRLVTCHYDGNIRLWDLEPFCTPYFSITGTLFNPGVDPWTTMNPRNSNQRDAKYSSRYEHSDSIPFHISLEKNFFPYQPKENARFLTLGNKLTTSLNLSANSFSHPIIDATLAGKHHLLTLFEDGVITLTRLS